MKTSFGHTCHHPHCDLPVPPKMLACRAHWFQLPRGLRDGIWAAYVPGQEVTKSPTPQYLHVMRDCIEFWVSGEGSNQ